MPTLIPGPSRIAAHGDPPKIIEEFIGRVNTGDDRLSIARMVSPAGWSEPGQTPEFTEFTVVLRGMVCIESRDGIAQVHAGQAAITSPGEWVRYSSPGPEGAEYFAVCLPAFSAQSVHRDAEE